MELCVQSGALEFKLIEEPGQRDYSGTTQMMKGLENTVNNHVRPKKTFFFFNCRKETSERGTLVFKYKMDNSREEGNLLSSTSIANRSRSGIKT